MSNNSNDAEKERLKQALRHLNGRVDILTAILGSLLGPVKVAGDPDQDLSAFVAELADRVPKGYTSRDAAYLDGKREALEDLSRIAGESSITMTVSVGVER